MQKCYERNFINIYFIKDEFNKNLIEELARTEYKMLNKIFK